MKTNRWVFERQNPTEIAFYFFNHSVLGRSYSYQPRKVRNQKPDYICYNCGKSIKAYVLNEGKNIICHSCKSELNELNLSEERKQIVQIAMDKAVEFKEMLKNCEKLGTCDILTSHHELLKDDENRLKTDFLLKLICKNDYEEKWNEIKTNVKIHNNK